MRTLAAAAVAAILAGIPGCNRSGTSSPVPSPTNAQSSASAVDDTVRTMLQYDAVKAGRDAREKAGKAAAAHNKDMDEAAGE